MDKQEFLLLIPAIVFGVAIVDLLKIFQHKKNYFETVGWGLYLLLAISWLWYETFDKLDTVLMGKLGYFIIIFQAILYTTVAHILSPEEKDTDTKHYFMSSYKSFFLLLALLAAFLIFFQYVIYDDNHIVWVRFAAVAVFLCCAFINSVWLRCAVLVTLTAFKIFIIITL